jgi:dihydrofolate reductase
MVEIIYGVAASLDGFIAAADGNVDWLSPFASAGADHVGAFLKTVDALIMGSRTYEQTLAFGGVASFGKPCYVLSSRSLPGGPNVTVTADAPQQVADELERQGSKRAWHFGGAKSFEAFRDAGLITGYSLGIVPVVLGDGVPLFKSPGRPAHLRLTDSKAYPSGVVLLSYEAETLAPRPERTRRENRAKSKSLAR